MVEDVLNIWFFAAASDHGHNDDLARGRIALADVDLRDLVPVGGSTIDRSRGKK